MGPTPYHDPSYGVDDRGNVTLTVGVHSTRDLAGVETQVIRLHRKLGFDERGLL